MEFVISGQTRLRHFLQLLAACTKMADKLFLESSSTTLTLRAVSDSQSVHFLAEIPIQMFDSYRSSCISGTLSSHHSAANPAPVKEVQLISRAVAASILRFCPSMVRLAASYQPSLSADQFTFTVFCHNGVTKVFELCVGEQAASEKADLNATDALMGFRATAEPRAWGGLLSLLPPSSKAIRLAPSVHRLTISECGMTSNTTHDSAVTVSADPRSFALYTYVASAVEGGDGSSPSFSHNTGGHRGINAVVFPTKTIESKPLRWFFSLCEALSLTVRVSTGGPGLPVQLDGIKTVPPTGGHAAGGATWHQNATTFGFGGSSQVGDASSQLTVSILSLLVAAIDGDVPNCVESRHSGVLDRSASRVPPTLGGATNDALIHVPTAVSSGDLLTSGVQIGDTTMSSAVTLAGPSTRGLRRDGSVASMVGPSFAEMPSTPPHRKRGRGEDDDNFLRSCDSKMSSVVPGSAARSDATCLAGNSALRSTRGDGAGSQDLSAVAASSVAIMSYRGENEDSLALHPQVAAPLDFYSLCNDDGDVDENGEDFALNQFITTAACRFAGTPSDVRPRHHGVVSDLLTTPSDAVDFASALLMVAGSQ